MSGALLEIAIILVLVGTNGVLAASEIAVVTSRKSRLRIRADQGDRRARAALELAGAPNRFLSTVQIGITAIAVIAGAFGGSRVAATLEPILVAWGTPASIAGNLAIVLIIVAITYVTLVVGELVPKRIALHDPERVAARLAGPMRALSKIATPFVHVLATSTESILRFLPMNARVEDVVTEDEIRSMVARATESGTIEPTEQDIVDRLFRLSDTTVGMLMTPRESIVWLDHESEPDAWRDRLGEIQHTRYIVADGDLDAPLGYVKVQELLAQVLLGSPVELDALLRTPHILPSWTPAFHLLDVFQRSGDHIALVTGERGEIMGLATLNDLLEGLVGELPELTDVPAPGMVQRADGSWLVDGLIPFEEFLESFEQVGTGVPHFSTLHSFMVEESDGPPRPASVIHWRDLRLEVVDMDGGRVDKVLVSVEGKATRSPQVFPKEVGEGS